MIRVLLMIFVVMCSFAVAQTEEMPQAFKIDEFERATNGYVKMKMDYFYTELFNDPSAQGYIINYGTAREIAVRERQIRDAIRFRKFDSSRITVVNGGFRGVVKSEFWRVPAGAENPQIESSSRKLDEFERANSEDIAARLDSYFIELGNQPTATGFIVNFGAPKAVLVRENQIKKYIAMRKFDASRIKFIKGGANKTTKTEFWIDLPSTE